MKRLYAFFICLLAVLAMQAQIVTTTPDFPTENDEVTIIFDATKGTAGLKGFTGDVYAHTGVILSTGTSWQYAPTWGDNSAASCLPCKGLAGGVAGMSGLGQSWVFYSILCPLRSM